MRRSSRVITCGPTKEAWPRDFMAMLLSHEGWHATPIQSCDRSTSYALMIARPRKRWDWRSVYVGPNATPILKGNPWLSPIPMRRVTLRKNAKLRSRLCILLCRLSFERMGPVHKSRVSLNANKRTSCLWRVSPPEGASSSHRLRSGFLISLMSDPYRSATSLRGVCFTIPLNPKTSQTATNLVWRGPL